MIVALDIETVANRDMESLLPEPVCTDSRIKDPVKIEAHIAEKRISQREDMALDPLTGRICCYAMVGDDNGTMQAGAECAAAMTDEAETALLLPILGMLANDQTRIVTFNGVSFDLPYIYKRAMILGINIAEIGAPPLTTWTKRYAIERHFDLANIWYGWGQRQKGENLNRLASLVLRKSKTDIDVATFSTLMESQEGRDQIASYCLQDTKLTWELFERMQGVLFA